ncbi:MAG: hypothetical protein PUG70_03770 [Lachnospiraceae bacterium]|nr:hypothetical protein [Lachnospiraceae bacterium]MDY5522248.1 hypothetical protein [Agathobacter sp.]
MKAIDRTFSYKLFEGQLISFLKMILFTDDVKNLVCFEGTSVPEKYRDLVDIGYQGAGGEKGFGTYRCRVIH